MNVDRFTKILMTALIFLLSLNGFSPWINPPSAGAKDTAGISGNKTENHCSSAQKNSVKSLEAITESKRLLSYIESSVNDIKLTVNGIDQKINDLPSRNPSKRK